MVRFWDFSGWLYSLSDCLYVECLGFVKVSSTSGQFVHFCKHCRMVPAAFRARDAISYDRLSLNRARAHRSVCRGEGLDLNLTVSAFSSLAAAWERDPMDLIQNEAFSELVSSAVAGQQDLQRVFTEEVKNLLQNNSDSSLSTGYAPSDGGWVAAGTLWKCFPSEVSFENVEDAYKRLADDLGVSLTLRESTILLDYLMIISPSFSIPEELRSVEEDCMELNGDGDSDNDAI